jgi:hypothetical protein
MDLKRMSEIIKGKDSKKPKEGFIDKASNATKSAVKNLLNKAIEFAANTDYGKEKIQNFARNIDPYDYSTNSTNALDRAYQAGFKNVKELDRQILDEAFKKGNASTEDSVRMDLLNRYAGLTEKYKTLKKSQYAPTKGGKNEEYTSSPQIERLIGSQLADKKIKTKKELENWVKENATYKQDPNDINNYIPIQGKSGNYVSTIPALGQGTYGIGEDEKGTYLSYYDKWDLNPFSGMYSDKSVGKGSDSKIAKFGDWLLGNENEQTATRNIGKPTNMYGRIYINKKGNNGKGNKK